MKTEKRFEELRHVDIKGYEGLYALTEDFRIWSYGSQKFLKPQKEADWPIYQLYKNGKPKGVWSLKLIPQLYDENGEFIFKKEE